MAQKALSNGKTEAGLGSEYIPSESCAQYLIRTKVTALSTPGEGLVAGAPKRSVMKPAMHTQQVPKLLSPRGPAFARPGKQKG
jgi:hypothetical protein